MSRMRTLFALSLALSACGEAPEPAEAPMGESQSALTLRLATGGTGGTGGTGVIAAGTVDGTDGTAGGTGGATDLAAPGSDEPPTGGTDITGPGPGGLPPPPPGYAPNPAGPWAARPVVYRQSVAGVTGAEYADAWATHRDQHHHPAVLNGHADAGVRFTGVWHKNERIVDWASRRGMTEAEYLAEWQARDDAGWRLLDLDAHVAGNGTRFHAIWVDDYTPIAYRSHRRLSEAQLNAKLAAYALDGYRPTRINGYVERGTLVFTAVWVRDGRTDFIAHPELSSAEYAHLWSVYRDQGYAPVDIGPYRMGSNVRFSGIWLAQDASIDSWASARNLTADDFAEMDEDQSKSNRVLVDLDGYVDDGGTQRFTAIWHRPVQRRVITSNRPTAGAPDIAAMRAVIDAFEFEGGDGRRGKIGGFVIDLETGDWVGYDMHEPVYMASTSKVLIGARVAAHPSIDLTDTVNFDSTMWRGEDSRGFDLTDIDTDVSHQTFLTNMVRRSDTASTDYLWGLLADLDGPLGLQDWLHGAVGMQNVGELTDICQVDKRVSARSDACVMDVSCDTYQAFLRGGDGNWNATADEAACLAGLGNHRSLENFEDYYTTLANTITPAEYGRFFFALANGDLMSDADRGELLAVMDQGGSDSFNIGEGTVYDAFGTKNGGKTRVSTQVGIMWDWNSVAGDHADVTPRYAFALFTEDWNWQGDGDTTWARDAMRGVLGSALSFLQN